jgi:LysR family transcriptional regulator, transcriptional activator of the cysJI operon
MEERLQKFARLVDAGSFTKAAHLMHISQPALTSAIKKLERELQAELLVRGSHSFTLTTAGTIAYHAAKDLGARTQNLKLQLHEVANEKVTLNIGMIDSVADLLFVHDNTLPELEQNAHLSLTIDNSRNLVTYVEHNDIDVAFVAEPQIIPSALTSVSLGDEPLVLVTQTGYLPQTMAELTKGALYHFLSYNQRSWTYHLVHRYLSAKNITIHPTFYSTSPEIMLQLVLAHQAAAALPYLLVRPYLEEGRLACITIGESGTIARSIVGLHRRGRMLPTQAKTLIAQTQTSLNRLTAEATTRL